MALIKTVILPHSPLLIPEIGKINYNFLDKTNAAYEQIGHDLKNLGLETLIIISPHCPAQDNAFTINIAPEMEMNFKDFGFIPAKTSLAGDSLLADQIKNILPDELPLQLISEEALDYGSAIPAYLFHKINPDFKIIVIGPANELSLEKHYELGKYLKEVIEASEKKIAVLASSDLSHRLKKSSPGGYSPKGAKFDNKLIEHLSDKETAAENILKMDEKTIQDAGECGLKPIMVLLGILEGMPAQPHVLAYQTDFGVGYLSLEFKLLN